MVLQGDVQVYVLKRRLAIPVHGTTGAILFCQRRKVPVHLLSCYDRNRNPRRAACIEAGSRGTRQVKSITGI